MRESLRRGLLTVCVWLAGVSAVQATELQWWSHWAIEDNKKIVLFEAKRRFEAKNPGHTVTITFYEKKNMFTTLRAAFTAGSGFPDVVYYDIDAPEFMQAGWLADLSTGIRWENIEPYGKAFWTRPGPGGKMGVWALPLEAASDELYYNAKIFKQLGVTVPPGGSFTQEQFKDLVGKCAKAGYAAFATGAADRDWAAHYMPNGMLLDKLGSEDTLKLFKGEISWKDPRVVEVFHYYKELIDLGAYPKTLVQHDAGRGPSLLPHRAEGLHVPGRLLVHRPGVRGAGQGWPAQGLRAGHDELPADEGRQGPQPEVPRRGRLAGRRGQGPQPRAGRSRWSTPSPTSRSATCGWPRPACRPGSRPTWPRSTARSSGTSTSTRG